MKTKWHVAVIGGGITGLSAAFYLRQQVTEQRLPVEITLIESGSRLGGKIETERTEGFIMEKGPDSFLARKTGAVQLARDLGLERELVRNEKGQAYILHRGKLLPIPAGAVMGIPTRLAPFVTSPLFSLAGKLRAAGDLILPRQTREEDVALGTFFRRRLGDEVVEHLIEPLLSGIYAGDIDRLSLHATFPRFAEMEQKHRSLILGMIKNRPTDSRPRKPLGQFLTVSTGLQSLTEAAEQRLPPGSVIKHAPLRKLEPSNGRYHLRLDEDRVIEADAVILALPHPVTRRLLPGATLPPPPREIPSTSVATVILTYPESAVRLDREGTGFVVPRRENTTITACTWTHKKWPHTVPPGKAMLRCYVGRAGDDAIVDEPDEVILERVRNDLRRILNIQAEPELTRITRWKRAMPQYGVGHVEWLHQVTQTIQQHLPGVFLAGASYRGIGLPDCIDQGKRAAGQVLGHLLHNR